MGFTNLIAANIASLRVIDSMKAKEDPSDSNLYQKAEMQLESVCIDAVNLVDDYLLPTVSTAEGSVFYNTL